MWADAVFEGGGVKAIALVGALTVAEKHGYRWRRLAGSSAGAIIAALLSAGYKARELQKMLETLDYATFIRTDCWYCVPYVGPAARIWCKSGLHTGKEIEKWMAGHLRAKGIHTFADIHNGDLQIVASDITRGRLLVLPKDLKLYGLSPGDVSVARAVRMSCSIPFFFEPAVLRSRNKPRKNVIVDGSVLSNFPVWLFDKEFPRWPTFGFRLVSEERTGPNAIDGPISLFRALFQTMIDAHDTRYIEEHDKLRTIPIPSLGVRSTHFHISPQKRAALFKSGVTAAETFFRDWDFQQYIRLYRKDNAATVGHGRKNGGPRMTGTHRQKGRF